LYDILKFEYFSGYVEYTKTIVSDESNSDPDCDNHSDSESYEEIKSVFDCTEAKKIFCQNKIAEYEQLHSDLENIETREKNIKQSLFHYQNTLRNYAPFAGITTVLAIGSCIYNSDKRGLITLPMLVGGALYLSYEIHRLNENVSLLEKEKRNLLSKHLSLFARNNRKEPLAVIENEVNYLRTLTL